MTPDPSDVRVEVACSCGLRATSDLMPTADEPAFRFGPHARPGDDREHVRGRDGIGWAR
jgi:hypothetical protein